MTVSFNWSASKGQLTSLEVVNQRDTPLFPRSVENASSLNSLCVSVHGRVDSSQKSLSSSGLNPLSGRNGSGGDNSRNAPISVSDRTPASIVLMRPARLSRPLSILSAELPVTATFTEALSTKDLS